MTPEDLGAAERARLDEAERGVPWRRWGPYLAERAWGTVREDYSADGNAWASFPHDHARSRAYRWNEDGMAGICDDPRPAARAAERVLPSTGGGRKHMSEQPAGLSGSSATGPTTGSSGTGPTTLAIDIGGTGLKASVLDAR